MMAPHELSMILVYNVPYYPDGKLIVSRTDLDGILTHANDAFVEISGYTIDELIGQQHYILTSS